MPTYQNEIQAATSPALTLAIANMRPARRRRRRQRNARRGNKAPRNKRPQQQRPNRRKQQPPISECIAHYASALVDPVNTPAGACIPYGFPLPSQRCKIFQRGTFTCSTTGQGYVLCRPSIVNDAQAILSTTVLSVGTSATQLNAFTNLASTNTAQLPFSTAQMTGNYKEGRVVAYGLRVRYYGTEANRNGTVLLLEDVNHITLATSTYGTFSSQINGLSQRPTPDGKWQEVFCSGPVANSEVTFLDQAAFGASPTTSFHLCAYANGLPGDTYEFEFYEHAEFSGTGISGAQATHIDPTGYARVVEATKDASLTQPLSSRTSVEAFSNFLSAAGTTATAILNTASHYGASISPMLLQALQYLPPQQPFKQKSLGYVEEM